MPEIDMERDEVRRITRINNVSQARTKLRAKLTDNPNDEKASRWQARIDNYDLALQNLMAGLPEDGRDPNIPIGVVVGVPALGEKQ